MNQTYKEELNAFCEDAELAFLQDKSILIAGASGLIGSYLSDVIMRANKVLNNRTKLYAVVRNNKKAGARFKKYLNDPFFCLVKQDVVKKPKFDFAVDYIIHGASNANPVTIDADPIGTIKANVYGTLQLLEYGKACNAQKLLYISSSEIYGEPQEREAVYREESMGTVDPLDPRSCYTESKRVGENICVNYLKQYGLKSSIARLSYVYGPTFTSKDNRVVPQFMRRALNKEDIILKSTGNLVRSYTYVYDVASGLLKILKEGKEGEAYNVSNRNSNVSIGKIAQNLAEIAGVDLVYDLPAEEQDRGYSPFSKSILDSSKLENLGWEPKFDLKTGLERIYKILGGV